MSGTPLNRQLAEAFVRDADKVLAALEVAMSEHGTPDDDERLAVYTSNVHAMKSALANVGEPELAQVARRLEEAGHSRNRAALAAETPAFLRALRLVRDKVKPEDDPDGAEDGDRDFWREKLFNIQAACTAYDNRAAEDALAELNGKTWPRSDRELLKAVSVHLLHSDFEIAVELIAEHLK